MSYGDQAIEIKDSFGCNCAQAVLGSCCNELGLEKETAFRLCAFFGGGMRVGEVCGAVTGALMALGLKYGDENNRQCNCSREFLSAFQARYGTLLCRELLQGDDSNRKHLCPQLIRYAADYIEKELQKS